MTDMGKETESYAGRGEDYRGVRFMQDSRIASALETEECYVFE